MSGFESSDDEDQHYDESEFQIDRLDLSAYNYQVDLALSGLPGCRFKEIWRNLDKDIESLVTQEICVVFVLCTKGELNKYRVPDLLERLGDVGLTVHHYPFPDGQVPAMNCLTKMVREIKACIEQGKKTLVHCFGGLGRSCLVAVCLLLMLDSQMNTEQAIEKMRDVRGPRAIQTVKQYNFLNDFREKLAEYENQLGEDRSVSR